MTTPAVSPDDPMRLSGARWCEQHDRWECAANKADHHASAVRGMKYCRHHVGRSIDVARTQGEANLLAWSALAAVDSPHARPVDPGAVVLDQLRVAVMRADIYGELLRLQVAGEDDRGLVGATYAAGRDGERVETGERVRALVELEAQWRDRVVRFAKAAHDMGIAERHVELQQAQAAIVVVAFRSALEVGGRDLLPAVREEMTQRFLAELGTGALS